MTPALLPRGLFAALTRRYQGRLKVPLAASGSFCPYSTQMSIKFSDNLNESALSGVEIAPKHFGGSGISRFPVPRVLAAINRLPRPDRNRSFTIPAKSPRHSDRTTVLHGPARPPSR